MRQANVSLSSIENKLSAVDSVLKDMRVGFNGHDSAVPQTVEGCRGGGRSSVGIMDEAQLLNMNEMISEIHKCLVLGTLPSAPTRLHLHNASSVQRSHVVSDLLLDQLPHLDRELVSLNFPAPANSIDQNSLQLQRAVSSSTHRI